MKGKIGVTMLAAGIGLLLLGVFSLDRGINHV